MDFSGIKFVIVGAGFWGTTIAERIANILNEKVIILDKRNHLGGNSYSYFDNQTNIEIHKYGGHIFHTNNSDVWDYLNLFTEFNNYRHKVLTMYDEKLFTMPINLFTINNFYNTNLRPYEVDEFLKKELQGGNTDLESRNLEEAVITKIGRPLYEAFIKGYTKKQWQTDPLKLPANIIQRLPIRRNYNIDYFDDLYQGIPTKGYGEIFNKMLASSNIEIKLGVDYFDLKDQIPKETQVFYSGPIDRFFNYKYGELTWRTLDFMEETVSYSDFQGTAVINYAEEKIPYTRTHEFRHYHPEIDYSDLNNSIIFHETSRFASREDLPYYPIGSIEDKKVLSLYQDDAKSLSNVTLGGRLGEYCYYDMHHVVDKALTTFNQKVNLYP